ncbi:MAG: cell-wall, partial [Verrucomicrobiota bacterium]
NLGADNIIAANHRERLVSSSPLPHFLVAFYNDGMGNQVCFDTRSRSADEEYPVVFWDHELGTDENIDASRRASASRESAGVIASSFSDWLKSEVERFA